MVSRPINTPVIAPEWPRKLIVLRLRSVQHAAPTAWSQPPLMMSGARCRAHCSARNSTSWLCACTTLSRHLPSSQLRCSIHAMMNCALLLGAARATAGRLLAHSCQSPGCITCDLHAAVLPCLSISSGLLGISPLCQCRSAAHSCSLDARRCHLRDVPQQAAKSMQPSRLNMSMWTSSGSPQMVGIVRLTCFCPLVIAALSVTILTWAQQHKHRLAAMRKRLGDHAHDRNVVLHTGMSAMRAAWKRCGKARTVQTRRQCCNGQGPCEESMGTSRCISARWFDGPPRSGTNTVSREGSSGRACVFRGDLRSKRVRLCRTRRSAPKSCRMQTLQRKPFRSVLKTSCIGNISLASNALQARAATLSCAGCYR